MNKNGCYIDLHAHLDGSVTVDIAKKLAALQNIALPADNDEELLTLLSVPDSCESLNDFLQCFDLPGRLMQTSEGLQNAVTLVTGQSQALGVVIPDIRNLFFAELVSGVEAVALETGWNIVITSSSDKSALALANLRTLAARDVGAILLVPASDADETLAMEYRQAIRDYGRPVIQVDRIIPDLGVSLTAIHQRRGAKLAMEHLLDLGHRRVACVLGPTNTCAPRLSGVREACAQWGIALRERDLYPGAYTMESGYAVADAILEGDYTAVFCFNDMMAYGFYKRCRERGVSIPRDLSVMGFDGVLFSDYLEKPLSTVWQPARQLGVEAARQAFRELECPEGAGKRTLLEPRLQIRESTAPPVAGAVCWER